MFGPKSYVQTSRSVGLAVIAITAPTSAATRTSDSWRVSTAAGSPQRARRSSFASPMWRALVSHVARRMATGGGGASAYPTGGANSSAAAEFAELRETDTMWEIAEECQHGLDGQAEAVAVLSR